MDNITPIIFLDTLIMCIWIAQKYQLREKCISKYNYQYQIKNTVKFTPFSCVSLVDTIT